VSDHELAATLATQAGKLLLDVRVELADASGAERKAAGDKRSHDFLMEALAKERPGDAVLSEEGADNPIRLSSSRVWIVDPLDGTREFSELDREDWAVHVALWQDGELVAGAVALPAQNITLATPSVTAPPPAPAVPALWCRGPGPPRSRCRYATHSVEYWSKWVLPERKSRQWYRGLRMSTYTQAASTSGIRPPPSPSPGPPGCTPRGSTVRRCSTTGPTRSFPMSWCAGPNTPRRCWR